MRIAAIRPYRNSQSPKTNPMAFCGTMPIYKKLQKTFPAPRYSFPFRGNGGPFENIIKIFKTVYQQNKKPKILMVGTGEGQELLSILTVIKTICKNKNLEDASDITCIDILPKLTHEQFIKATKITRGVTFLPENIKETLECKKDSSFKYPIDYFNNEVISQAKSIINNSEKTKWNTSIQDFSAASLPNQYDIILMNNVLMYIENSPEKLTLMQNINKMLNTNGYLITDSLDDYSNSENRIFWERYIEPYLKSNCKKNSHGIWQK